MEPLQALVLVKDMTNNALFPCLVTLGDRLLFLQTRFSLLTKAKMAKLGFGPTIALYHSRKEPLRGHKRFDAFVVVLEMTNDKVLPCQVTHEDR